MSAATVTSTDLLLDFEVKIPCEGKYHDESCQGHVATEDGAYYVVAPCGSDALVQCKPRVAYLHKLNYLKCLSCNDTHHIDDYLFKPIGGTGK